MSLEKNITAKNDTIYALATPQGRSGVAIIRVSGPAALAGLEKLTRDISLPSIKPRYAYLATLQAPANVSRETSADAEEGRGTAIIDKAVVIYFKAPHSFTGEDVVEYHLHGSPAVISELCRHFAQMESYRPAERGEFTRRGFENNRMDLTEAESIADLIDAETSAQKDQALAQMSGTLRDLYEGWAGALTRALAHLEADLDFPDEDLPDSVAAQVFPKIQRIQSAITTHLNDNRRGERLRDGIKIAVIGAPNAGKSSLVNALAQRDIAIISDLAGTTRDVLEVHLDIGGYPVILSDTAGLKPELLHTLSENVSRETSAHDQIESEGIKRALRAAQSADLKLLVFDASQPADHATLGLEDKTSLLVYNKSDLLTETPPRGADQLMLSTETGQGIAALLTAIEQKITALIGNTGTPTLTRERHRHNLNECLECLNRALSAESGSIELIAEDLRLAVRALGRITGRVDVEDLLDLIFSEFCIGK